VCSQAKKAFQSLRFRHRAFMAAAILSVNKSEMIVHPGRFSHHIQEVSFRAATLVFRVNWSDFGGQWWSIVGLIQMPGGDAAHTLFYVSTIQYRQLERKQFLFSLN
jgi:hypothetical protein